MSDKSFGDHHRNIVKNPLLSNAVTSLSIEDLTHKAVLLPVTPSQGQITRLDQQQGLQTRALDRSDHGTAISPPGDALQIIPLSNTTPICPTTPYTNIESQNILKQDNNRNPIASKASAKSEDDFDVNEYIARLQGTRYVSAPIHSHLKEDSNANLEATEENLEEINLNDSQGPAEVQQSLTADIAQNFSQLPTVLPHVASAVFSSFSNMLSYKSREQTPDVNPALEQRIYDEIQFQKPDVGVPLQVDEYTVPKEVGPPPKEPPIGGTSNFRLTTKKKYAQIPGLSSESAPTMTFGVPTQNMPFGLNMSAQNMPIGQNMPPVSQDGNPLGLGVLPSGSTQLAQNSHPSIQKDPPTDQKPPQFVKVAPTGQNTSTIAPNVSANQNVETIFKADEKRFPETPSQYNIFNPIAENTNIVYKPAIGNENTLNISMHRDSSTFFTPIEQKESIAANMPSSTAIIPPPPMFSNMPKKEEKSQSIGKSILPPSVARRISANQPIIKPQVSAPSFTENLFVPSVPEVAQSTETTPNIPGMASSAFVPAHSTNVTSAMRPKELAQPISIMQSTSQISTDSVTQAGSVITSMQTSSNVPIPSGGSGVMSHVPLPFNAPITTSAPPANIPPASAIFAPSPDVKNDAVGLLPVSQLAPPPLTLFNPMQYTETKNVSQPITQLPSNATPEAARPLPEPPKAAVSNFRMTKKRPQYYAGPIEGVGDISNSFKPTIPSAMPSQIGGSNFQGALFTPTQEPITERNEVLTATPPSIPFDISKPVGNLPQEKPTEYNTSQDYSGFNIQQSQSQIYQQQYNTAFDLSRATTETYDNPNQESKGFGIIGSLKSKLSSIDINKIQNTVTTFFDPAYNENKVPDPRENQPLLTANYGYNQNFDNQSNLEIYVAEPQYPGYNFDQYYPNQGQTANQSAYSLSYFSDPNSNQQTHNSAIANTHNLGFTAVSGTTESASGQISENIQSSIYAFKPSSHIYSAPHDTTKVDEQKNKTFFNQNASVHENIYTPNTGTSVPKNESISFYNSSAEVFHKQLISEVNPLNSSDQYNTMISSSSTIQRKGATEFCSSGIITSRSQETLRNDALITPSTTDFFSQTHQFNQNSDNDNKTLFDAQPEHDEGSYDSALNTSKYNLSNLQVQPVQPNQTKTLIAPADFFDEPKWINPQQPYMKHVLTDPETINPLHLKENMEPRRSSQTCIAPIGSKIRSEKNVDDNKKDKDLEFSHEKNLIASLSKDDIPILGVSTAPLFGVTALTKDETKNIVNVETVGSPKDLSGLDISALKITDVENVLLIEPPLENIGAVLKRNASSSKLESTKMEDPGNDYFRQNVSGASSLFVDNQNENFFKHTSLEADTNDLQKSEKVEIGKSSESSELNICGICREVSTPERAQESTPKEVEDLTTQLIENVTSRISLSNPVTAPFTEDDKPVDAFTQIEDRQLQQEITDIAEDTMETLQVQSATELLDDQVTSSESRTYGWTQDSANSLTAMRDQDNCHTIDSEQTFVGEHDYSFNIHRNVSTMAGNDYDFEIDPNAIGFFGNNSLFFENIPQNASDEIKAEIKNTHDEIVLPRQMSIPSAPPAEDDTKSDETGGLDVMSIEQDAKKDFPLDEEFIIEPSETDDDKIEVRERKRSSEDSTSSDTFTDRVERFKKAADNLNDNIFGSQDAQLYNNPPLSMASYFDTGNYAVESHYKKSVTPVQKPSQHYQNSSLYEYVSIPPGFEDHYQNIFRDADETPKAPSIPDTSTQTRPTLTPTFTSAQDTNINSCGISKTEEAQRHSQAPMVEPVPDSFLRHVGSTNPNAHGDNIGVQPLSDPIKFFSKEESKPTVQEEPESFNRLASYFSMPAPQPDHSKSFFELSQSQNHYRHEPKTAEDEHAKSFFELSQSQNHYIDDVAKNNIANLMLDLTSPRNLVEQIVTTVNHFSVDYNVNVNQTNNARPIKLNLTDDLNAKLDVDKNPNTDIKSNDAKKLVENDCIDSNTVLNCKYCAKLIPDSKLKVRTAVNEITEATNAKEMMKGHDGAEKKSVTINFDSVTKPDSHHGTTVATEHRMTSEYTPVKHHWFYRVDVEDKSVWRGFSTADSQAIETAYSSPELNESTLVATDGGRFDVNVMGRLRIAVYWKEKPTNVRRCSWFYKGTTDPRYVPYTEAVAEKLEEEYRHGVTTGEWHRKLVLPNSEMVIMHGPSVMVHFLQSTATDAFSTPPSVLGKRVYRNPLKIHFPHDQRSAVDHLLFIVHGAGEFRKHVKQATSRPRVVRRGHEESEIEDCEPSGIDHLLLLCHGVGSACDLRFRSVEEVVDDFRTTSLQLLQSHYKNSYDSGIVNRVEVLPISWHSQLHSGQTGVDRRLSRLTLDSIPRLRAFTNHTVLDVLFYTSPVFQQTIIDTVCSELNRIYELFKQRNPSFKGTVSLGGHSLGSVILYDLLCHQTTEGSPPMGHKTYVSGASVPPTVRYPQLGFHPAALYALGSPIAIFECIRGVESLGLDFHLPTCRHLFNIFHPYDPIAYRIEPLINPELERVKPQLIPHHKGRKRMHLELKDTMARVGADLKQKLIESVRTTWNKWKAYPPTDGQLEKVVEVEIEKEPLCEEGDEAAEVQPSAAMVGRLNSGRRVDYVLQEAPLEMINEYLFAMSSHVGYWESEDTMLLMLREVYSSLGVQPDTTVPQQNMAVHRSAADDSRIGMENDHPSTSRGSTS